jgi:demethylmenaquinone methyltransferase/2-methoxy-6-polyprenyl-1,4-benzoquinol methylase
MPNAISSVWHSIALPNAEQPTVIAGMQQYYDERATEFDEWYLRRGKYADPEHDARWHSELAQLTDWVKTFGRGRMLELASGTGWWTQHLARRAHVTALDYAPTMLELARKRLCEVNAPANLTRGDAYHLPFAAAAFDAIFFGFWLSHIPRDLLAPFFGEVKRVLRVGGQVMIVDSKPYRGEQPNVDLKQERILNDGSRHHIVKVYHTPATLHALLAQCGAHVETGTTGTFFTMGRYVKG